MGGGVGGGGRVRAGGGGRRGGGLLARKSAMTLGSDLTPDGLRAKAWADYAETRAEMLRLAREQWSRFIPDEPLPDVVAGDAGGEGRLVRRVLGSWPVGCAPTTVCVLTRGGCGCVSGWRWRWSAIRPYWFWMGPCPGWTLWAVA